MHPSSLVLVSPYLGPRSNYAQSQGLNRKQPGLVCASAVIKRGAKKGINDLIEEERKRGKSHRLWERRGEYEWGAWNAPGAGDCGIAEVCQDFGRPPEQMVACRSHTIYSPLCQPRTASFVPPHCFAAKVHGQREGGKKKKNNTTKLKHWSSLLQLNSLSISLSLSHSFSLPPKVLTKSKRMLCLQCLVCQAWHIAIHSCLMWQCPPTAKPPLLLHRLLITVDKHAGGDPPPHTHTSLSSIHTNWDLRDTLPPGNSGSTCSRNYSSYPRFQNDKVIRRKVKNSLLLKKTNKKKKRNKVGWSTVKPQGWQTWW